MQLVTRTHQHPVGLKTREEGDIQTRTLFGYINKFNTDSVDMGGFVEQVSPGAFADSLKRNDVVALMNHDTSLVLGRLSAGTLRLSEDEIGLAFEIDLPDTTTGRDLATLVERGDHRYCSFGFCIDASRQENIDGKEYVFLDKIDLYEVSVGVTFPAYDSSTTEVRSREDLRQRAKNRIKILDVMYR